MSIDFAALKQYVQNAEEAYDSVADVVLGIIDDAFEKANELVDQAADLFGETDATEPVAEEAPEGFKVGNRVKVKDSAISNRGQSGVIEKANELAYLIALDSGEKVYFYHFELELTDEPVIKSASSDMFDDIIKHFSNQPGGQPLAEIWKSARKTGNAPNLTKVWNEIKKGLL
jgi:hypothetical protein